MTKYSPWQGYNAALQLKGEGSVLVKHQRFVDASKAYRKGLSALHMREHHGAVECHVGMCVCACSCVREFVVCVCVCFYTVRIISDSSNHQHSPVALILFHTPARPLAATVFGW